MKHIKLFEQFVNEDKIQNALDNIDKWMPEDSELQDEYYQLINAKDEKGMEEFLDMYADEDRLMKYGIKFQDLGKLAKAILKESVNEATVHTISGNSGRTITTLDDKKYELKKEVKDARIGNYVNVVLPKGTIITNLPGGIFANHEDLKTKYCTGYKAERWLDKHGVMIRQMPETIHEIEKNGKVLESLNEDLSASEVTQIEKYLSKLDAGVLFDMVNDFYTEDDEWNEIKNDLDKSELEEWALAHIKSDAIKLKDLKSMYESTVNEATETAINQLAKDEQSEGYDAKVFLGRFDGQTFKAQSTDKTWQDGVPVMKNFSRNGFKPVSLKGEYQLVDSDRGWWYIQGPKNMWYAVKHADYGTPPFEY